MAKGSAAKQAVRCPGGWLVGNRAHVRCPSSCSVPWLDKFRSAMNKSDPARDPDDVEAEETSAKIDDDDTLRMLEVFVGTYFRSAQKHI